MDCLVKINNVTAIIQARTGSTRFPNKVFAVLCDKPIIWHIVDRVRSCKNVGNIVLATTLNSSDDTLKRWGKENNVLVYCGSENDVLDRFYNAALISNAEVILRITADDPFRDPVIIDSVINLLFDKKLDFAYNNKPPTFPEGLDVEVFTFSALELAQNESRDAFEREHVTQYFYRHPEKFKQENFSNNKNLSYLRLTIDTEKDLEMAKILYEELYRQGEIFLLSDIMELIKEKPWIANINNNVKRSAMYSGVNKKG
jgi:Spore coat polysaccharide biosynthesis protein F, CMP-KDO synthetase homolog